MPCFHPMEAWYAKTANPTGKHSLVFPRKGAEPPASADLSRPITVPCSKCIGCRLERSKKWAIRCEHERQLHEESCFITLTYAPEHLPAEGSLNKRDFQLFLKRLRKYLGEKQIRYYMCGEYGEKRGRPHYHAIVFGVNFHDRSVVGKKNGITYYESATISRIWGMGQTQIGDANFETAAYCARYITKKLTGERAKEYGKKIPEYNNPSRRPGLGKKWIEKYMGDVYPHDQVTLKGKTLKPPKFYDSQYEIIEPKKMEEIKKRRKEFAEANRPTKQRLKQMKEIMKSKFIKLKRGYENV
ncbi:MAG: replication initiator protein [Microviridae sp.]|nr:MAG: replication initiator protein [Microviridae sp.]